MITLVVGPVASGKTRLAREMCVAGAWWLNLNPAAPLTGCLACCELYAPGEKPAGFRFLGSLHLHRSPLQAIEALRWALGLSADLDLVVELPLSSLSSVAVYVYRQLYRTLKPGKIVSMGMESPEAILAVISDVEIEVMAPQGSAEQRSPAAIAAFRRSQVRNYFSPTATHNLHFREFAVLGSRFGSGVALDTGELEEVRSIGIRDAEYAEVDGRTLYAITSSDAQPAAVTACADRYGCRDAHLVHPKAFAGLAVGLENTNGDHFAVGRIIAMDFGGGSLTIESPMEAPAPVGALHMGLWRTDDDGNDIGELRPWQV